ncbi:MAG: bacterioferritin [bacterium]
MSHHQKVSDELLNMLNLAIAREMQVSIQYLWQHVQWSGVKAFTVKDELRRIALAEMRHAELIAERLFYLGGTPTTRPEPIFVGSNIKEMIEQNSKDEMGAIELYKKIIRKADEEDDITTRKLFEQILGEEEEHLDTFEGWLEDL